MNTPDVPPEPQHSSIDPRTMTGAPRKKGWTRRRTVVVAAGVVGALALGAGVVVLTGDDGPVAAEGSAGPVDVGPMQFASVQTNVARDKQFSFSGSSDDVGIYLDPLLTMPAPDALEVGMGSTPTIVPKDVAVFGNDFVTEERIPLAVAGEWGFADTYYVAERADASGAQLPTPKVTVFTVATTVPKTTVAFEADDNGVGHFSWDPVEGAERYYVVTVTAAPVDSIAGGLSSVRIIGDTTETEWTSIEQDEAVQRSLPTASPSYNGVGLMHQAFNTYQVPEDRQHEAGGAPVVDQRHPVMVGVVAKTPEGLSPLAILGEDITGALPSGRAHNATTEMGALDQDIHAADLLPTSMPITMTDGRTLMRPMIYDVEGMKPTSGQIATADPDGHYSWKVAPILYRVSYRVGGSMFVGEYTIEAPDLATAQAAVRPVADRIAAETKKGGVAESYSYQAPSTVFDPEDVSTTAPAVPYPVNGTNPLTIYLAANLIAGEQYIDLSAYLPAGGSMTTSGITYVDAFTEALDQNPFILQKVSMTYHPGLRMMGVSYPGYATPEERAAEQERLAAEVATVTSTIITPGMGERDKVLAINTYLSSSAEYDYPALAAPDTVPNAWTATGILLDKKGVCSSYAKSFTALADAAGLESMYVTGIASASGERHAWNKVLVDGAWRALDVTWNDSVPSDQFLLLTDAQMAETRTQDADWVVDSRVGDFAAI